MIKKLQELENFVLNNAKTQVSNLLVKDYLTLFFVKKKKLFAKAHFFMYYGNFPCLKQNKSFLFYLTLFLTKNSAK